MNKVTTKEAKEIKKDIFDCGGFVSIQNIEEGKEWFVALEDKFIEDHKKGIEHPFEEVFLMWSDHRETLKKLFGKPSFYFRGEFYYHDHVFEYKGHLFLVGTAKDKGTCYEVFKIKDKPFKGVVSEFLTEIHSKLLSVIKK